MSKGMHDGKNHRRGLAAAPTVEIPEWAIGDKDGAGLASALALAGFEDKWIHLGAESQRAVLGFPVFGKHSIHFDGQVFRVNHSAVGGGYTDNFTPAEVSAAARARKKL